VPVDVEIARHECRDVEGDLQRAFGEALRAERHRRGISQEDWGAVLGMHRTRAGAIERGEQNLTLRSVERIAERLGLEALVLLAGARVDGGGVVLRAADDGGDPGSGSVRHRPGRSTAPPSGRRRRD
jgi:ribosome-binding protein aMBF1 (putative translation factor)